MGNCVQSSSGGGSGSCHQGVRPVAVQLQMRGRSSEEVKETEADQVAPSSVVKVKMVLTKGELGSLVARLKAGDRRLEDVLHEMERGKKRDTGVDGWRPSLERIVECPQAETAAAADS